VPPVVPVAPPMETSVVWTCEIVFERNPHTIVAFFGTVA
jgi:hypothetical protein